MSEIPGEAVTIIKAEDHSFELDEEVLNNILLHNDIKDKKVVVISVAGAFRKGKSFILNFILRYLKEEGKPGWLGDSAQPLKGFSWRGGSERDTTGILLWNQVYTVSLPSGEKVAVLLMDTQGAFDSSSTVKECATVFALSTMLSSIQVYNISQNLQEDDLQHLELFTEYGRLAMEEIEDKPFQKLLFLVRDWSFPYEADYGYAGGKKLLERRLMISEKQHPQLQQLRKHIRNCFSDVECFLMPHPGLEVATSPNFDGRLSDIRPEFKDNLQDLVKLLLAPQNLIPKQISGRYVSAKELINYFKAYIEIFKGGELPEPKSMLDATAEANNLSAVASSKEFYNFEMEKVCGGNRPYINTENLKKIHHEIRHYAVQKFNESKKMGSEELAHSYQEKLLKEIEEMFSSYSRFNDGKQIAHAVRTPVTLLMLAVICYLNSTLLRTVGLEAFAVSINLFCALSLMALALWAYCRFSGDQQHIGVFIDNLVFIFLTNFIFPSQKHIAQAFLGDAVKNNNQTEIIKPGNFSPPPVSQNSTIHRRKN